MGNKPSDFRYNTGATRVPWAAVGENYNVSDIMTVIEFLMQGEGLDYEEALKGVREQVGKLSAISSPPGKLSLGSMVEKAEEAVNNYLGIDLIRYVKPDVIITHSPEDYMRNHLEVSRLVYSASFSSSVPMLLLIIRLIGG